MMSAALSLTQLKLMINNAEQQCALQKIPLNQVVVEIKIFRTCEHDIASSQISAEAKFAKLHTDANLTRFVIEN